MLRKLFLLAAVFLLLSCVSLSVYADFGDEATLGGQNASDEYRWRVTSDGDLIPGEDSATDLGTTGNEVQTVYADDITITTITLTSGDNNLYADPSIDNMTAGDTTISYDYGIFNKTTTGVETLTLADGTAGDTIHIIYARGSSGKVTVIADTQTGWTTGYLNSNGDSITFYYVNDSVGWIVIGSAGQHQSVVNSLLDQIGN